MSSDQKRLHNTPPRETGGSLAGDRLDYQYQRAAEACLTLLEDSDSCCVLLEWHDDFVNEKQTGTSVLYGFNQVKTRNASQGPWKISQVFGLPRANSQPSSDSIASKLFEHYTNFGDSCSEVVLITNSGIDDEFEKLISDVSRIMGSSGLDEKSKKNFDKVVHHWTKEESPTHGVTADQIFNFIARIKLKPEAARIDRSAIDYKGTLSELIFKFSEIDLTTSQAGSICSELLELVKEKSNFTLEAKHLPITPEDLRSRKGIQVSDLLPLLSLSNDAYLELRRSGTPVIKTLSRLQRVCSSSGFNQTQTVTVCKLKTDWDVWYFKHRSTLQDSDLSLLRGECSNVLDSYSKTNVKFAQLVRDAEDIAKRYEPKLPVRGLSAELVMGLIFAITAERGPSVGTI